MTVLKSAVRRFLRYVHPINKQQNLLLVIGIVGDRLNNARLMRGFPVLVRTFF